MTHHTMRCQVGVSTTRCNASQFKLLLTWVPAGVRRRMLYDSYGAMPMHAKEAQSAQALCSWPRSGLGQGCVPLLRVYSAQQSSHSPLLARMTLRSALLRLCCNCGTCGPPSGGLLRERGAIRHLLAWPALLAARDGCRHMQRSLLPAIRGSSPMQPAHSSILHANSAASFPVRTAALHRDPQSWLCARCDCGCKAAEQQAAQLCDHVHAIADAAAYLRSVRVASSCPSCGSSTHAYMLCPPVEQLMLHARAALQVESFTGVEPETLTCLALAMSGGQERLETWNDDTGCLRIGLCQVRAAGHAAKTHALYAWMVGHQLAH